MKLLEENRAKGKEEQKGDAKQPKGGKAKAKAKGQAKGKAKARAKADAPKKRGRPCKRPAAAMAAATSSDEGEPKEPVAPNDRPPAAAIVPEDLKNLPHTFARRAKPTSKNGMLKYAKIYKVFHTVILPHVATSNLTRTQAEDRGSTHKRYLVYRACQLTYTYCYVDLVLSVELLYL